MAGKYNELARHGAAHVGQIASLLVWKLEQWFQLHRFELAPVVTQVRNRR